METEQHIVRPSSSTQPMEVIKTVLPPPPPTLAVAAASEQQQLQQTIDQTMEVPDQIVVSKKDKKEKSSKSHRKKRSSKDKEKVAKRKSSSGKHERKSRRSASGKDAEGKERRRRRRRERKSSSKKGEPDANDPETLAKSRELLLAAMGVKKKPDIAPCFVSAKNSLDNNPVYQSNKKRISALATRGLPLSQSESLLSSAVTRSEHGTNTTSSMETAKSMDDISGFHNSLRMEMTNSSNAIQEEQQPGLDNSEYDQYVEF